METKVILRNCALCGEAATIFDGGVHVDTYKCRTTRCSFNYVTTLPLDQWNGVHKEIEMAVTAAYEKGYSDGYSDEVMDHE